MAATIKDVAENAGVSIATVSNVLNGKTGQYGDETRARVIRAAHRLGYSRSRLLRGVKGKHTQCLGVTFVDQNHSLGENYYLTEVLDGIMQAAREKGFNVSLHTRLRQNHETDQLKELLDGAVDGLFMVAPHFDSPLIPLLVYAQVPHVVIGVDTPARDASWIDVDNRAGARMAAEHLLELGHRMMVHFAGHPRQRAAQIRAEVFRAVVEKAGGVCATVQCGQFDQGDALTAARRLFASGVIPDAVFAANDGMALGVLQAAEECGLRVPQDLSVIGFDDMRESASVEPPLTTIRQPMYNLGQTAAEWLIGRIKGEGAPPLAVRVPPELVVRASTAAGR